MSRLDLYGVAAALLSPALLPLVALHPRLRRYPWERLGMRPPPLEPGALWFHAASLGEGQAAAAVTAALARTHPGLPVLRTATSDTGRQQVLPADARAILPLDVPWLLRRWLARVRPRALVLVEGELWPGLLKTCRGRIPVAMLAQRVGPGTRRLARNMPGLFHELAACVTHWSARDEQDAAWLEAHLGHAVPVVGDLKSEAPSMAPAVSWSGRAIIAGSTHEGEEEALLEAMGHLDQPAPLLVLAPRHPGRFAPVAAMLQRRGLRWVRRSTLKHQVPPQVQVLLLDSVGELRGLYQAADAAFVGGTYSIRVRGHSAAEPAAAGLPIVHGPLVDANRSSFGRARCFPAHEKADLADALGAALVAGRRLPPPGQATGRATAFLEPLLDAAPLPERPLRPMLWPLVPLVAAGATIRRGLARPWTASLPVISVGNLASGGTGKTPVVLWLARWCQRRGLRPAILFRGYRRQRKGPALRVGEGAGASARLLGDEAAMAAQRGYLVLSCPHRGVAAQEAARRGADVLLLDDGLQQTSLAVDLHVVVLDARRLDAGGPIPVGERREPWSALARAGLVWLHGGPLPDSHQSRLPEGIHMVQASYQPQVWLQGGRERSLDALTGQVAAFAGVARPGRFFRGLRAMGLHTVRTRAFPDHHSYPPDRWQELVRWAAGLPLVTTEKDAARLMGEPWFGGEPDLWALRIQTRVTAGAAALERSLLGVVGARGGGAHGEEGHG